MEIQWSLVLFTTLAGAGAWLYFAFCLAALRGYVKNEGTRLVACVATLVLLIAGSVISATHLSHPDRIMAVLGHPTMGIFTEALFVGLTSVAVIVYFLAARRKAPEGAQKALLVVGAALALPLTVMLGYSYMMPARPTWDTPLLPLAYMLTASSGGAAAYLVIAAIGKEGERALKLGSTLLVASGILVAVSALGYGVFSNSLSGDSALLWAATLLCGAVAPAVLGYAAKSKPSQALVFGAAAFVFALVGCTAFRCMLWMAGTAIRNYFGIII